MRRRHGDEEVGLGHLHAPRHPPLPYQCHREASARRAGREAGGAHGLAPGVGGGGSGQATQAGEWLVRLEVVVYSGGVLCLLLAAFRTGWLVLLVYVDAG